MFWNVECVTVHDGNVKGKTWGPSTVHQRERGHLLPAMSEKSARLPEFSKSAPNLDKARAQQTSASTPHSSTTTLSYQHQQQHHQSSSGRLNVLGKSVDGLATNSCSASGNVKYSFDRLNEDDDNEDADDDDDDEERPVKGCFSFNARRKKFSLDSKMDEHSQHTDDARVPIVGFVQPEHTQDTDKSHVGHDNDVIINANGQTRNPDNVEYDRVFYRKMQNSVDDIFARVNASQRARNSKSSGDLTEYDDEFRRSCFVVHNGDSAGEDGADDSEEERNRSDKSIASFQDTDLSQTSTDSPLDSSFASINLNGRSFDERTNSMCSDQSAIVLTASGRSSVSFRMDDMFHGATGQPGEPLSHRSDASSVNVSAQFLPSLTEQRSMVIGHHDKSPHYYHMKPVRATNGDGGDAHRNAPVLKKDKVSKPKLGSLKQFFKPRRGTALLQSNSFYKRRNNGADLNEQLLDDEQTNTNSTVEPKYEAFSTRRFVALAKRNEN